MAVYPGDYLLPVFPHSQVWHASLNRNGKELSNPLYLKRGDFLKYGWSKTLFGGRRVQHLVYAEYSASLEEKDDAEIGLYLAQTKQRKQFEELKKNCVNAFSNTDRTKFYISLFDDSNFVAIIFETSADPFAVKAAKRLSQEMLQRLPGLKTSSFR
jgi:hypothetical protein